MKSLQEKYGNAANNTVNNNNSEVTNMTNIKSVEIVVNLILSAQGASAGYFQKLENDSNGRTLVRGRSYSSVHTNVKAGDDSAFAVFVPLPEKRVDSHGRNNTAVVIFHMEDGSTKILDAAQTEEFWADTLNLPADFDVNSVDFNCTVDIPNYRASELSKLFKSNAARAMSIKFDGMPQFTTGSNTYKGMTRLVLRPSNARVEFTRTTVGDDNTVIGFTNSRNVLAAKPSSVAKFDATQFTKSAKRRDNRRAQAAAARASVETAVEAPLVMDFGGSTVVSTVEEAPTTPVVETPVVDAEKEALRKENAELKAQVAELSANVANLTAMMQQFMASQAAPQPVAEPTPVVEEVTLEPVAEVEEAPAVEETVEEAPAPKLGSREWLAARRAKAAEAKARKSAGNSGFSAEDLLSFDA